VHTHDSIAASALATSQFLSVTHTNGSPVFHRLTSADSASFCDRSSQTLLS
jgi:hypothetical protein